MGDATDEMPSSRSPSEAKHQIVWSNRLSPSGASGSNIPRSRRAVEASQVLNELLGNMLDILNVAPESLLYVPVFDQFSAYLQARDRCPQIVRQPCQHDGALPFVGFDPDEHLIEALCELANLARTCKRD